MKNEIETIADEGLTSSESTFFVKQNMVYSAENILSLAKEGGNISSDLKKPVYQYIFGFIGYRFDHVIVDEKEFESVVFLTPDGRQLSTTASVIIDMMHQIFEQSAFVAKDETGNIKMKDGFCLTTEVIRPCAFTYYEGRGNHAGYAKLL
jgi:hypothetical protein